MWAAASRCSVSCRWIADVEVAAPQLAQSCRERARSFGKLLDVLHLLLLDGHFCLLERSCLLAGCPYGCC